MSPEQAEMSAQDIDTRSDIYSLGVLLYELLIGALPFDRGTLHKAALGEIQRLIREVDPPKPSTRVSELMRASQRESMVASVNRRTETKTLSRQLRGDLDWIVMKALEKDRERRYETANGLAADIQRHLNDEPVLASPPSAAYKMTKFVRRNRAGVTAAAIVLVVLIAGIIGTSWGFIQASASRKVAQTESANAKAINDFLTDDLLAAVAPSAKAGKGKDVLMRDVLDEASKKIDQESKVGGKFTNKPLIEASIRATLGETYRKLGEYKRAEPHLERALKLRREVLGAEHPDTLDSMNNLAILYRRQGRDKEAETLMLNALEIQKRVLGEEHPDTLESMGALSFMYFLQSRNDEENKLSDKIHDIKKRVHSTEEEDTLPAMGNLAELDSIQQRKDNPEQMMLKTLEIQKRILGEEDPETINTMTALAGLYDALGRYDEAEPLYVKALESEKHIFGEEHPITLRTMAAHAGLYVALGRYDEAEPLYVKTLEIQKSIHGEEYPSTLYTMQDLAVLYAEEGRQDEAESLYLNTLEIGKRVLGVESMFMLMSMKRLADSVQLYVKLGRLDDARPLVRAFNKIQLKNAEKPDASVNDKNNCAWTLLTCEPADLRDPETALRLARQAVDMTKAANPGILDTLALAQHLTGDTPGAIETEKKALSLQPPGPSTLRSSLEASLAKYEAALKDAPAPVGAGGG